MLDDARGVGDSDLTDRPRTPGELHRVPQPRPGGRHGPDRRSRQPWATHPWAWGAASRSATTPNTAMRSEPSRVAWPISTAAPRGSRSGWRDSTRLRPAPIPLLIAASGERRALRIVAGHADIWHTFADGEAFRQKAQILDRHCEGTGPRPRGRSSARCWSAEIRSQAGRVSSTLASRCSSSA